MLKFLNVVKNGGAIYDIGSNWLPVFISNGSKPGQL
jgi:hypothetical protein